MTEYVCDHCGKVFPTNAGLYSHKEENHKPGAVVLVNHDNHQPSTSFADGPMSSGAHLVSTPGPGDDDETAISLGEVDQVVQIRKREHNHDGNDVDDLKSKKIIIPRSKDGNSNDDYKRLYLKCLNEAKKLKYENKHMHRKVKNVQRECQEKLSSYRAKIDKINKEHRQSTIGIEEEYRKSLKALESECENRIKTLNEYISDLKNNGYSNFNSLSKIIFNCVTIEEIHRIRHLIRTQQFGELLNKHMHTLQNIMLGITVGVIPICNSQRSIISEDQRKLVSAIQDKPASIAKRIIQNNRTDFTKLWSIVDDSLQLVCDTYNRYGSLDEDNSTSN